MKPNEVLEQIVQSLRPYHPIRIILFGSCARGDQDEMSDVDLVILKETKSSFIQRYRDIAPYLKNEIPVDLFVYTPAEFQRMRESGNPFIERVLSEGKVVYEES
jgi:predicted nucleotidyltransferase